MTEEEGVMKKGPESEGQNEPQDDAVDENPAAESGTSGQGGDGSMELLSRIQELETELQQMHDKYLREVAESQNSQRRAREVLEKVRKFESQTLARELLPILDNFDRTLLAAESGSSLESLLGGVKAIERQLWKALAQAGVKRIESLGEVFDPNFHEAIATDSDSDAPEDTISAEIEPGYCLHDRVLRPAKVLVVKKSEG